jgi:hypothetical protein
MTDEAIRQWSSIAFIAGGIMMVAWPGTRSPWPFVCGVALIVIGILVDTGAI